MSILAIHYTGNNLLLAAPGRTCAVHANNWRCEGGDRLTVLLCRAAVQSDPSPHHALTMSTCLDAAAALSSNVYELSWGYQTGGKRNEATHLPNWKGMRARCVALHEVRRGLREFDRRALAPAPLRPIAQIALALSRLRQPCRVPHARHPSGKH
ncbi:hypothetical protein BD779DRAFT_1605619, partial [Infundibulicybe gibba]